MRIAFCIPGNQFSSRFLNSWTNLIKALDPSWEWFFINGYVPNIFFNRQALLERAKMLRPTHYMWIDSDQVFSWNNFIKLVEHNVPIVSGLYHRSFGFDGSGPKDKFAGALLGGAAIRDKDIKNRKGLMEVHANGMGFMLVQRQVFDLVVNPFYSNNPDTWEDFSFAEKARAKGFKSYVDPEIIVGHEKMVVI